MKTEIHPQYYKEARVACACGNSFTVGATVEEITTEVCCACHPFFTGEQRIVDTAGQVERFMRRLEAGVSHRERERDRREQRKKREREAQRKRRGLAPLSAHRRSTSRQSAATPDENPEEKPAEPSPAPDKG